MNCDLTPEEMALVESAIDDTGIDLPDDLMEKLYDCFFESGDMPYGIAKARTGDPWEWIYEHLDCITG